MLAALGQMVECLPLDQQVRGSIPGGVVNFHLKISTSGLGGVEMYTFYSLDCTSQSWIKFQTLPQYVC